MSAIVAELDRLSCRVEMLSAELGRRVDVGELGVTSRTGELPLGPVGEPVSPNGACRIFRAADGWMALNLAREEDRDLLSAWLLTDAEAEPWALVESEGPQHTTEDLVARAALLGLPAACVGEVSCDEDEPPLRRFGSSASLAPRRLRVVDLSALWAGPMCGAILAAMGGDVLKIESLHRPDPTPRSTPRFDARLNGGKTRLVLDLTTRAGQAELRDRVLEADVVISSARRRGLASVGLDPKAILESRPGLNWVAITGYGWPPEDADDGLPERVAFGDDAAAAGGLVGWSADGRPHFLGDALSDPLTGLAAAAGALAGIRQGGGVMVDAAMARIAARGSRGDRG